MLHGTEVAKRLYEAANEELVRLHVYEAADLPAWQNINDDLNDYWKFLAKTAIEAYKQ